MRFARNASDFLLRGLRVFVVNLIASSDRSPQTEVHRHTVHPGHPELALAYPTRLPHAYAHGQQGNARTVLALSPPRREVDSPYAWFRLGVSVLLSTVGGVGMWSVVV